MRFVEKIHEKMLIFEKVSFALNKVKLIYFWLYMYGTGNTIYGMMAVGSRTYLSKKKWFLYNEYHFQCTMLRSFPWRLLRMFLYDMDVSWDEKMKAKDGYNHKKVIAL